MRYASPWVLPSPTRHLQNGSTGPVESPETDENVEVISNALWGLIEEGKLLIRRGGYIVRRGRGRVIVEPRED